ncbi:carboxymuconolactone decarboxylase family protein [Hoeflea sp.]|uniref:carboxymuconolactone decarboxylase family protein n=1 Tax=Hoeflea sp. TaxID=1940281 RepID=UPI003B526CE4
MTRIPLPASIEDTPQSARPMLEQVKAQLGSVPNLFRLTATSPAALRGYLGLSGALSGGELDAPTRERVALAVSQLNSCQYCLAAHTYIGKNIAKLDDAEIAANRKGGSSDPRADVAVRFAVKLVETRGSVSDADLSAVKLAGFSDAEIVEIIAHVALNTLTNYLNEALGTPIDFPAVSAEVA